MHRSWKLAIVLIMLIWLAACSNQSQTASQPSTPPSADSPATTDPPATAESVRPPATIAPSADVSASPWPTADSPATETPESQPAAATPDATPEHPVLPAGWTEINPGGDAICARGTPYRFWVRPGNVNRLLVFFEGGGGCWNAATCREGSSFFDDTVDAGDSPQGQRGIFDLDNPDNPFRDYYMVYIPYCTGDVHWGDNVQTYRDTQGEVSINHTGFRNAQTAIDWIIGQFSDPDNIFVTGCSAGSIGSIAWAPYLIRQYPQTHVAQLGDSEAFLFDRPIDLQVDYRAHDNFPAWIPATQAIQPGRFSMPEYYVAIADYYPDYTFAQYNTAADAVQIRYFQALDNTSASWPDALARSLAQIEADAPNFRSFTAGGAAHCILPFDRFYSYRVEQARFRDWVADLAADRPVTTIRCGQCEAAQE